MKQLQLQNSNLHMEKALSFRSVKSAGIEKAILFCLFGFLVPGSLMAQITPSSIGMCAGSVTSFVASGSGGSWTSSNPSIARVGSTGVVTGITPGTALISYTVSGVTSTAVVAVDPVTTNTYSGAITGTGVLCIGSSTTLTTTGTSGGSWFTKYGFNTINSTGVITGSNIGRDSIFYCVGNSCSSTSNINNGQLNHIYTIAGSASATYTGDNGPDFLSTIEGTGDMVSDASGNLYVCDYNASVVRKISSGGIITTVAGNGVFGNTNDNNGSQATNAQLKSPNGIFVDNAGNIFISNTSNYTIQKVNTSGVISTIAGTGVAGFSGDGGPATAAKIRLPQGLCEDAAGNVYFADEGNFRVREILASSGNIITVAGTGTSGYNHDGLAATTESLSQVMDVKMDNSGNIYIADNQNERIRKYVPSTGIMTTIAGTGTASESGDGGPATAATFYAPVRLTFDGANCLYVSDQNNQVIRKINLSTGIITRVAGTPGSSGFSGDGGAATSALLYNPCGIAFDNAGNFIISDGNNNRLRQVPTSGTIAIASASGSTHICSGTSLTFNAAASVSGIVAYQWLKNGSATGTNSSSLTVSAASNGDVVSCIATVTPPCGTSYNDTSNYVTISVDKSASSITGVSLLSVGKSVTLSDSGTAGTWTSGTPGIAAIGSSTGVLTGVAAGTTIVTYSVNNMCGSSSATIVAAVSLYPVDTISATASNGSITPPGSTLLLNGWSQSYAITPQTGYHVSSVTVDGSNVGAVSGYTFSSITGNHTICAYHSINVYTISASAGSDGSISPAGATGVNHGSSLTYTITPAPGYHIASVLVDGSSVGAISSYTFSSVTGPHTIAASFAFTCVAPSVTCSGNITQGADAGACSAVVNYSAATATGTSPVITYSQNSGTAFAVGITTVTATAANVCGTATGNFTITVNPNSLNLSKTSANVSCYGGTNGSISTTVSGGTGSYTYTWSGGASGANPTGLAAGTYSLTVSDAGCGAETAVSTIVTLTQPTAISESVSAGSVACFGAVTTVSVTATGGTGTLAGTGTYTVTAGAHNYTVTDANGCSASSSVTISQPSAIAITGTLTNATCMDAGNGSIATSVTGGTGGYTYLWNNGNTATGITGLSVGSYSLAVTDANNCSAVYTTSVGLTPRTVAVRLVNSLGNGIAGGTVQYYNGTWLSMGTTDSDGYVCMNFPTTTYSSGFTTYFQVLYAGGSKQWGGVAVSSNPVLVATTTSVSLNLVDHNGNDITTDSGAVGMYNGSWTSLGSTSNNGYVKKELLPGSYIFNMNYHNYTEQLSVTVGSGPTQNVNFQTTLVTLNLQDHTGTLITSESGTGGYYTGNWYTIGNTGSAGNVSIELLPGSYFFSMNFHNYTEQQNVTITSGPTQNVNFETTLVSLDLKDHTGSLITATSGTGGYYTGNWYTIGSTGTNGYANIELLPGSYYFEMNYNNYTQQQSATVNSGPTQTVTFQTTLVTLNLLDHTGALITAESGTGGYYTGNWYTLGSTGTGGSVSAEFLPGNYYFDMNFHNYTQQQSVTVNAATTQTINFQTCLVTLNLIDHNGAPITAESGTGGYYTGNWYTIGSTGSTGTVSYEFLPGSGYYFSMNFHNFTQQKSVSVTSGTTQVINFQTTLVSLNLLDHTGAYITSESGTGGYYTGNWYTIGNTGSTGFVSMEFLPGGYYFSMNYHNFTQQLSVTINSDTLQAVNFQTTLVSLNLLDHTGTPITGESGTGGYYTGNWYIVGSTGSTGTTAMEFLPGGYYFSMNFHNYTQQMSVTVNADTLQNVNFQTTLVTLALEDHTGALITGESGTAGYYSGGWYNIGSTGSAGFVNMEFLPGSYFFNMNFHNGTQQIGSMNVNGAPWTQTVTFQTALVTIHFEGNTGVAHSGAAIQYYSGGWYSLGTTNTSGNASMEMLPVSYLYNATLSGYGTTQAGWFTDAAGGTPTHTIQATGAGRESSSADSTLATANETTPEAVISVYPNPATDGLFNVVLPEVYKNGEIYVMDLSGKIIDQKTITDNVGTPVQFSLDNFAKGIYLVKVITGETTFATKLVSK